MSDDRITIRASVNDIWQQGDMTQGTRTVPDSLKRVKGIEITKGYKVQSTTCTKPLYIFETVSESFTRNKKAESVNCKTGNKSGSSTRGTVVTNDNFNNNPIGVFAWFDKRESQPFYMWDEQFDCSGHDNKSYFPVNNFLWPEYKHDGSNHLSFFAYSPCLKGADSPVSIGKDETNGKANIKLHYIVPDEIEKQHDLLVTPPSKLSDKSEMENGIPLHFDHALTSVRFKYPEKGMYPGTITKIVIKNIVGEGTYDMTTRTWDTSDAPLRDFTYKPDVIVDEEIYGNKDPDHKDDFVNHDGNIVGDDFFTLMLMPQNSEDREGPEPEVSVEFVDLASGATHTFTSRLKIDWRAGQAYTYNIKTSSMHTEYYFNVKVKGGDIMKKNAHEASESYPDDARKISARGNLNRSQDNQPEVEVESWYEIAHLDNDGKVITYGRCPAQWHTYATNYNNDSGSYVDAADTPSWFKSMDAMQGGSDKDKEESPLTVDPTVVHIKAETIVNYEVKSVEKDKMYNAYNANKYVNYDLSTEGGTKPRNTANCYIVSSPGTYKIPLVYGNAIKDGHDNPGAYTHSPGANILSEFLRHDDKPIKNPWIHKNIKSDGKYITPAKLKLERFQSIAGHIEHKDKSGEDRIELKGIEKDTGNDEMFLKFEIHNKEGGIYPGNFLVSIQDNEGTTLWTWHIWITGLFIGDNEMYNEELGVKLMKHSIGSTAWNKLTYDERELLLHLVQVDERDEPTEDFYVRFKQDGWEAIDIPQTLSYQFGRMTPLYAHIYRRYVDETGNAEIISYHRPFQTAADANNKVLEIRKDGANTIGYVLRHPKIIFWGKIGNDYQVYNYGTPYKNLWNNGTDDSPVKTVYDPSPPGFMVPPTRYFPTHDFWKIASEVNFNISYNDVKEDEFCMFKVGNSYFERGAAVTGFDIDTEHPDGVIPNHNFRYTPYWTAKYVPGTGVEIFGFQFDTPEGTTDSEKNYNNLNRPKKAKTWAPGSFKPAWLSAVRPIKEP